MPQSISLDTTTIKRVIHGLQKLEELKSALLSSIPEKALNYGSSLWWDKVEQMADNDIQKGNFRQFQSVKDLIKDLHR